MSAFTAEDFRLRALGHLPVADLYGDYALNPGFEDRMKAAQYQDAAVLIGLREQDGESRIILTQRTAHLAKHGGQVAFPGGKIDPQDASPEAAALREAHEEIGLDPGHVEILGRLPDYLTGSGYRIKPVLALVSTDAVFMPNPDEVEAVFEVPVSFLMTLDNYQRESRVWQGIERHFYTMHYGNRFIWGVTAGIIRMMHERLYR
ncbi:MAG: CoA pyrophosphatase [Rhizobiaceae bacterium]